MIQFRFYPQHDAMDCGPACLRMIAAYYGRIYPLGLLREFSNIGRLGVSMLGISEAAEKIGFRTTGVMVGVDSLQKATLPCIVHWNQQHFVVLYGIERKKGKRLMLVADPSAGKLQYTEEEFLRCWAGTNCDSHDAGVALLLEPTPAFYEYQEERKQNRGIGFLLPYFKPYKKLLTQLFAGLLFASLIQLILPFLTQSIVDFGISAQNTDFITLVLLAQLTLILSSSALGFIRGWILLHLGMRMNIALISDFLIKLMRLPMGYFDTKMTGDILQRINDHTRIQNYLTNSGLNILFSAFTILVFSIILWFYSVKIFLIFVVGSILYFLWVRLFMKRRAIIDHKSFEQLSANQNNVIQLVTGMSEIKLNGCEQQKRWEWERIQAMLFRLRVKGLALGQYQDSGAVLINQTKNIIITAVAAFSVVNGQMTLGMMLAVQYIIGQLNTPVDQIIGFLRDTQDAKLSLNRLSEIQDQQDEEPDDKLSITEIPEKTSIRLRNVSFSYDSTSVAQPVLQDIDLIIPEGKQTAIVGLSGSGKTTLVKLLLGFYPVSSGEILLGQHQLTNYHLREWRRRCGVVMQDGFIFSDSIARNIAPGVEIIDKQRLLLAAETANIIDFVDALPLGYNTKIGNNGQGLSQGQKQRILIARAVYRNPDYVFLDEATNALDANNEKTIMQHLREFLKGKTSVVVAHRLSTVKDADQIVVIDKGKIVETGTHIELTAKHGAYYHLVKNQLEL
jgi:ATP-binding cassette, subfamily B, bacterial